MQEVADVRNGDDQRGMTRGNCTTVEGGGANGSCRSISVLLVP